jgi:hypothetical protein
MSEQDGWLQISTAGFASFNKARPPGHLVKELVQNAFDAIGDDLGRVALDYRTENGRFHVYCRDTGGGLADLDIMRVVYLTMKTDSHLKRGRFGRGFKEILSVAEAAMVGSGSQMIHFLIRDGRHVTRKQDLAQPMRGTSVTMIFDWPPATSAEFDAYFGRFLVPDNIEFLLNGKALARRAVRYAIDTQLTTEIYLPESQSWSKPRRKTRVELVEVAADEAPHIYEMGIPVAEAEWTVPFHANVLQRVPMNPNRDALASGYARRIHAACLPVLLPDLSAEAATADWVGAAGAECEAGVQKEIVTKAYGENAVRAVPSMGKRDFNDDAERAGATIVNTAQMSSGFREMAKAHLPSAKQHFEEVQEERRKQVAGARFSIEEATEQPDARRQWIERQGGRDHVDACLAFAVWFCQQLVDSTPDPGKPVTGAVALGRAGAEFGTHFGAFLAHWSSDNVLTLALDTDCFWRQPLGDEALSILVHEAAHGQNQHHGKSFAEEVERLAGVAAATMYRHAAHIARQWPQLAG